MYGSAIKTDRSVFKLDRPLSIKRSRTMDDRLKETKEKWWVNFSFDQGEKN